MSETGHGASPQPDFGDQRLPENGPTPAGTGAARSGATAELAGILPPDGTAGVTGMTEGVADPPDLDPAGPVYDEGKDTELRTGEDRPTDDEDAR